MRHLKYIGAKQSNVPILQDAIPVKVMPHNRKPCEL